ncbi:hypothetical protein [Nitrobacter sp. TKz-YC02]|uniref:hypothetical protein n=1 Tax=Nitrobacter sp. TKz-YC02 TaxID=3398704 RepID=UPI003CE9FFA6
MQEEIAHLRSLDLIGLQCRWQSVMGRPAPEHLPKHLLFGILAHRIQADAVCAENLIRVDDVTESPNLVA